MNTLKSGGITTLKILTLLAKLAGFVASLDAIPFIPSPVGIFIFAAASILKDVINRICDLLDDGKENQSYKFLYK